ncbi:MAG: Ig-like domain-containing protein, partial [Candidatus Rokuibacteriota bacterium]
MTARLIVLLALAVVLIPASTGPQLVDTAPRPVAGQSATLLPDGRWLLLGGEVRGGVTVGAALWDPRTQTTSPVAGRLGTARAWHTATVLPDGRALIVGGVTAGGATASVERFDPATQTFEAVATHALIARARHTATLLTDGRVVIAGGVGADGAPVGAVEAWDWRTGATHPAGALGAPRAGHEAVLLGDGTVRLWGGEGEGGLPWQTGEVYNPATQTATTETTRPATGESSSSPARLEASLPGEGAVDVPADVVIALRFSRPLRPETANPATIVLVGGGRVEPATVVAAEGGRLVFVTPESPLQSGAAYTLSFNGAVDSAGFLLPAASLTFTTAPGPTPAPPTSSSDAAPVPAAPPAATDDSGHGHAHVTNPDGHPAVDQTAPVELDDREWTGERREGKPYSRWQELPPLQAPPGVTALAGQVLRLNGRPLADATLRIGGRSTRTDATGRFLLTGIPAGYPTLVMDGSTASRKGKTYGTFDKGVHVEAGVTTVLPYTIWLPLIDTQHATRVPVPTPQEIVATTPRVPGLEMRIPAGVVLRMRDGQPLRWVTLTQ